MTSRFQTAIYHPLIQGINQLFDHGYNRSHLSNLSRRLGKSFERLYRFFLSQGRARLHDLQGCFTMENTQLSPSLTRKPCKLTKLRLRLTWKVLLSGMYRDITIGGKASDAQGPLEGPEDGGAINLSYIVILHRIIPSKTALCES